ncbi:MAG TPA: BON domain-containing protein [Vicinamibacterales bacterium]
MNTGNLLVGAGLGAALAYMLDPDTGNRRCALLRDQLVRAGRKTRGGLDATARDVVNRGRGVAAVTRARLRPEHVDDDTLRERVRAKLGHVSAHPRAIDVHVQNGNVTLRGPILASEITDVLTTVSNIRGVRAVTNELDTHESSDNIPSLQGEGKGATSRFRPSPATRALVAAGVATGVWMYAKR